MAWDSHIGTCSVPPYWNIGLNGNDPIQFGEVDFEGISQSG